MAPEGGVPGAIRAVVPMAPIWRRREGFGRLTSVSAIASTWRPKINRWSKTSHLGSPDPPLGVCIRKGAGARPSPA